MARSDEPGFSAVVPGLGDFAPNGDGFPAAGSAGITAAMDSAALAEGVVVSVLGQSSQVVPDRATVGVGDTLGMSSDATVPPGGDPMTGLSNAILTNNGSGLGSVVTPHHPAAANVGSLASQVDGMRPS